MGIDWGDEELVDSPPPLYFDTMSTVMLGWWNGMCQFYRDNPDCTELEERKAMHMCLSLAWQLYLDSIDPKS